MSSLEPHRSRTPADLLLDSVVFILVLLLVVSIIGSFAWLIISLTTT